MAAGVAVARGKAAKGRFLSVYIFIFGFTKVQLTERIFIIYNFKENRNIARNVALNVRPCTEPRRVMDVAHNIARNVAPDMRALRLHLVESVASQTID